jgi:hypothetical protein
MRLVARWEARRHVRAVVRPRLVGVDEKVRLHEAAQLDQRARARQPEIAAQRAVHRLVVDAAGAFVVLAGRLPQPRRVAHVFDGSERRRHGRRLVLRLGRDQRLRCHRLRLLGGCDLRLQLQHHLLELLHFRLHLAQIGLLRECGGCSETGDRKSDSKKSVEHR